MASGKNAALVDWVRSETSRARRTHQNFYERVNRCQMYYRYGEPDVETSYDWQSKVRSRMIRPTIEHIIAAATDSRPQSVVLPRNPDDAGLSALMNECIVFEHGRLKIERLIERYVRDMWVAGMAFMDVGWNPFAREAVLEVVDARNMDWDPDVDRVEQAAWLCRRTLVPLARLKRIYGEKAKDVRAEYRYTTDAPMTMRPDIEDIVEKEPKTIEAISASAGKIAQLPRDEYTAFSPDAGEMVMLYELWTGPEPIRTGERLSLDRGRRVVVAGNTLLDDSENPYRDWEHHAFPFVPLVFDEVVTTDVTRSGPSGLVEQLIPMERQIGHMLRMFADHMFLEARPWLMVPEGSGVTDRSLRDPRHLIRFREIASGSRPAWLQAAGLSADFAAIYKMFRENFDVVSMVFSVDRGQEPGEIRSGVAIRSLQKVMERGVRIGIRHLESSLGEIGARHTERIAQYWTDDRVIRIALPNGMFRMEEMSRQFLPVVGEDGQEEMIPSEMEDGTPEIDEMSGLPMMIPKLQIVSRFHDSRFDFEIKTGSTLPSDPEARFSQAITLYNTQRHEDGVLNTQQLLATTDFSAHAEFLQPPEGQMAPPPGGLPPGGPPQGLPPGGPAPQAPGQLSPQDAALFAAEGG